MGIYDEVTASGDPVAPGLQATTEPVNVDPDPFGELPVLSEAEFAAMFGPEGMKLPGRGQPQIYTQVREAPSDPANPRQADRASDIGGPAGRIVRMAQSFVGTPYVWGGSTPAGFDCSGFVQYVYAKAGINLPRVSFQQAAAGPRLALSSLQAGDLVAWDNSTRNNGADHIAIYLGGGLIAEAPRPGVALRVRKLGNNESAWGVRVL